MCAPGFNQSLMDKKINALLLLLERVLWLVSEIKIFLKQMDIFFLWSSVRARAAWPGAHAVHAGSQQQAAGGLQPGLVGAPDGRIGGAPAAGESGECLEVSVLCA